MQLLSLSAPTPPLLLTWSFLHVYLGSALIIDGGFLLRFLWLLQPLSTNCWTANKDSSSFIFDLSFILAVSLHLYIPIASTVHVSLGHKHNELIQCVGTASICIFHNINVRPTLPKTPQVLGGIIICL